MVVYNKRHSGVPKDAIYIGRPSKWGNPYSHLESGLAKYKVGTREEAVESYRLWVLERPWMIAEIKRELKGKDLVCWCAPGACHGYVLEEIANGPD